MSLTTETAASPLAGLHHQVLAGNDRRACLAMLFAMMRLQRARNRDVFPGANPVSLERSMLPALRGERYWVGHKTDGERFLVMAVRHKNERLCVFVDRSMRMFIVPGCLPTTSFDNTLLDGELVFSKEADRWQLLVFDAVYLAGIDVASLPFSVRMELLSAWSQDLGDGLEGVQLLVKRFEVHGKGALPPTDLPTDGLVFVPDSRPYTCYRNDALLKWKSGQMHTVDFKVHGGKLCVLSKGRLVPKQAVHVTDTGIARQGTVVECVLDSNGQGQWRVHKLRTDKTAPNDLYVLDKTVLNVRENIQRDELG